MLILLYTLGIATSILFIIFEYREKYKNAFISASISIFCGVLYVTLAIYKIFSNPLEADFWTIFSLLSLVFLIFAILSHNGTDCIMYIFAALVTSGLWCVFFQSLYVTNSYVHCNENHNYEKTFTIVSTYDGSEFGKNIFGNGFIVGFFKKTKVKGCIYKYYYIEDNGNIKTNTVLENYVEFSYIEPETEPYVEIYYTVKCSGYNTLTHKHKISAIYKTHYILYIPENSITLIEAENY